MPAAIIPAIIGAGASIGSSVIQSRAAGKAVKAQQQAGSDVIDRVGPMYDPYRSVGGAAVNSLGDMMGLSFDHIGFQPSNGPARGGQAVPRPTWGQSRGVHTPPPAHRDQNGWLAPNNVETSSRGIPGQSMGDMGTYEPPREAGDDFMTTMTRSSYGAGPLGGPIYDQSGLEVARY